MKNPQRTAAYILICGIASFCMRAFGLPDIWNVAISLGLCSLVFLRVKISFKKKILISFAAAFFAAAFCFLGALRAESILSAKEISYSLIDENEHEIKGNVDGEGYVSSYGARYYVTSSEIDGKSGKKCRFAIDVPYDLELFEGDVIYAYGVFSETDGFSSFYETEGIYAVLDAHDVEFLSSGKAGFFSKIRSFALTLSEKLSGVIGNDEGRIASAMVLGDKSRISDEIKLDFRRAGASHVLAVSGMHLSVLIMALRLFLSKISKRKRNVVLIVSALAYAAITGFSPSVSRAALMCMLFLISEIIGDEADGITSLFISLAVIIAVDPNAVFGAGLWLSFAATLGILVVVPAFKFNRLVPKKEDKIAMRLLKNAALYLIKLILVGAAAQMFTFPVMMLSFGGISALSLISGMIVVPISAVALVLSMIACVFMYIPGVSVFFAFFARLPLSLLLWSTRSLSDIEGAYVSVNQPFAIVIACVCAAATLTVIFVKRADKRLILSIGAAGAAAFVICLSIAAAIRSGTTDIIYSVSNKNESVIVGTGGNCIVIDVSAGGYSTLSNAASEVNNIYSHEIDYLVLTHLHSNHIGSVCRLISNIKVRNIVVPTAESETDAEILRSLSLYLEDKVNIIYYNRASESAIDIGGVTISLPQYVMIKRSTHPVIAFSVEENDHRVGYLGASSFDSDDNVNKIYLTSDVLIVGVHGPKPQAEFPLGYSPATYAVIGKNDVSPVFVGAFEGDLLYAADTGGRIHIVFENNSK